MIEEILEPENLAQAWKRVKANKGAPGIDGMTVEDFPAFAWKEWPRITRAIAEGSYRPAPVRRSWIDKPDGTKRPLGIPTVLDRVIQQAVAQVLGPVFEVGFSEHSGLPACLDGRVAGCLAALGSVPAAPPRKRWPRCQPAGRKAAATP